MFQVSFSFGEHPYKLIIEDPSFLRYENDKRSPIIGRVSGTPRRIRHGTFVRQWKQSNKSFYSLEREYISNPARKNELNAIRHRNFSRARGVTSDLRQRWSRNNVITFRTNLESPIICTSFYTRNPGVCYFGKLS